MGVKIENKNVIALRIGNTPIVKRYINGSIVYRSVVPEVTDYDILAVYNVDDTSSATRILSNINHVEYAYLNDRPIDVAMDYAFAQSGTYTLKVKLQDKIDSVPSYSFKSCKNLVSVDISARLTVLGTEAFYGCTKLTSVTLPDTLTAIYADAFYNCNSLTSIEIPTTVTEIGSSAFENCSSLTSIVIPEGVTTIESDTFSSCHRLRNVVIPSSVTSIGARAFTGCRYLPSIIIPENVTSIGESAFYYCPELIQITCNATTAPILGTRVLTSLSNANDGVLYYPCGSDYSSWMAQLNQNPTVWTSECIKGELEYNVTMTCTSPSSDVDIYFLNDVSRVEKMEIDGVEVTPVGNKAFNSGVHTIKVKFSGNTIPSNTLYTIGSIDISEDIEVIETGAFQLTDKLTSVTLSSYNKYYTAKNNCVIELLSGKMIAGVGEFTIPEDVTSIGISAAWNNDFITEISIPDSVTTIEDGAFSDCSSLLSVTIGSGVTSVGNGVFTRCGHLSSITVNTTTAPTINGYLDEFVSYGGFSIAEAGTLSYPCGSDYSAWIAQLPNRWVDGCSMGEIDIEFDDYLEFKVNNKTITATESPYRATLSDVGVSSPEEITSYSFDSSATNSKVTKINKLPFTSKILNTSNLFNNCQFLTEVNIDGWDLSGVKNANFMFAYCRSLTSIVRGDEVVESFGDTFSPTSTQGMFGGCTNLVNIPYVNCHATTNTSHMFYDCQKVKTITLPDTLWYVETTSLMFDGCYELETISAKTTSSGVEFGANWNMGSISNRWTSASAMFRNCYALKQLPFREFNTSFYKLENVSQMLMNCRTITSVNLDSRNADTWLDLKYINSCFAGCENLLSINLTPWDLTSSDITNVNNLFDGDYKLQYVNFGNWNLDNVTDYSSMFNGCSALYSLNFDNTPSCTTYDLMQSALEEAGIKDNVMFNGYMPDCGDSGSGYSALSFIMNDYTGSEYRINGYSQSFSSSNENELYSATTEDMKSMAGNEITSLSFGGGIKQFVAIPSISTLNELEFYNLDVDLIDLSKTNLNNLTKFNLYSCSNLKHIDLSNWTSFNVYDYDFFSHCSYLKSVKMLNCCEEAIQFVRDRLSDNGINATVITEENNTYLSLDYNSTPIWYYIGGKAFSTSSRLTDLSGQMDYDSSLGTMFRYSDKLTTVYTMPALSGTTSHKSMFNGCTNLKYQDLTTWDFNFIDGSQDISTFFQSCNNLVWVNFSGWDLANAVNYESMFYDCGNLKYVFAYGCNEDTISKLNTAIDNSGSSAELIY